MSIDNNALRALVREALQDAIAAKGKLELPQSPAAVTEQISLSSNSDVFVFVQRILDMATDSATANRLRSGQIRFELALSQPGSAAVDAGTANSALRIERGAITESMVNKAAAEGGKLIAGSAAVITPLARERARKLGVTITKEAPTNRRDR
jgi:hypothetical protein